MEWGKKRLVDFKAGKTQLASFDQSNYNGSIDLKMDGSVVEEKSSFRMLGLTFCSKLDWSSYIISIAKTASKKFGLLILSIFFSVLMLLCISLYKTTMHGILLSRPDWCCLLLLGIFR